MVALPSNAVIFTMVTRVGKLLQQLAMWLQ